MCRGKIGQRQYHLGLTASFSMQCCGATATARITRPYHCNVDFMLFHNKRGKALVPGSRENEDEKENGESGREIRRGVERRSHKVLYVRENTDALM